MAHDAERFSALASRLSEQAQRWVAAGVFESMAHDFRVLLRLAEGKAAQHAAVIVDGRTMQSTPESGGRTGYDGYKRKNG